MESKSLSITKEGNQVSNFLAKFSSSNDEDLNQFLPTSYGEDQLQHDKRQMPILRSKYSKASVFIR